MISFTICTPHPLFLSISGNNFIRQSTSSIISTDIFPIFSRYTHQFQSILSPVSVDTLSSFSRYSPQFQSILSPISVDTLPNFSRYPPQFQSIPSPISVDIFPIFSRYPPHFAKKIPGFYNKTREQIIMISQEKSCLILI